ncbi:MAG: MotA/TolQ/ExbB proton channel family protein [Planctomycetota bacterium]|jgi:biopolymer transport protein ExbB
MSAMLEAPIDILQDLAARGGWVMWALGGLSVLSLTLIFERVWFWCATNSPGRKSKFDKVARHLRNGERNKAEALIEGDASVYGQLVHRLLLDGASEANATAAIESQRTRMDRFMPTLGTVITASPMLGILGTVVGIIRAFGALEASQTLSDPSLVGGGIAQALLTTVAGLVVALVVLFPFNGFRAQIDRTLGRMESLIAAACMSEDTAPRL